MRYDPHKGSLGFNGLSWWEESMEWPVQLSGRCHCEVDREVQLLSASGQSSCRCVSCSCAEAGIWGEQVFTAFCYKQAGKQNDRTYVFPISHPSIRDIQVCCSGYRLIHRTQQSRAGASAFVRVPIADLFQMACAGKMRNGRVRCCGCGTWFRRNGEWR